MRRTGRFVRFLLAALILPASVRGADLIRDVEFHTVDGQAQSGIVYCPRTRGAIRLDGALDEPDWQRAEEKTGFVLHFGRGPAPQQTFVRGLWDGKIVYLGLRCEVAEVDHIKADASPEKEDNEAAYGDDCLDIFLAPYPPVLAQFVLSASGARTDYRSREVSWDGHWRSAVGRYAQGWSAEIAFHLEEMRFGEASAGRSIALNVGRATAPNRYISSLFPGYADIDRFGLLVLGTSEERQRRNDAIRTSRYRLEDLG